MNHTILYGRLGADPESRFTPNGQKVTTFRMAVNCRIKGQEDTMWWRVTVWGDRFDKMMTYLKKGSAVVVVGEMKKPEIFTGKDGQPQIGLEITAETIHFSPFGGKGDGQGTEQHQVREAPAYAAVGRPAAIEEMNDDDPMPF